MLNKFFSRLYIIEKVKNMSWFLNFLIFLIGRKVVMSLIGLFFIVFLVVYFVGNLQLLVGDGGKVFNFYVEFMMINLLIKIIFYLLYVGILLYVFQGWVLWCKNWKVWGFKGYVVKVNKVVGINSFVVSNMGWLGIIIFVFIVVYMYQFWL